MFALLQLFQRTILAPLTLLTILTDWLDLLHRASTSATKVVDKGISNWESQIIADSTASNAAQSELAKAQADLATARAKRKTQDVVKTSEFTNTK